MRGLTKKQEEVWSLFKRGESIVEIAYRLHISVSAVYQRLDYAQRKINNLQGESDGELHS